jgi:putative phosphoribosyl transferase
MSNSLEHLTDSFTFTDLGAGGRQLADALTSYAADRDALVLGIVRGGVRAAFEVARRLDLPVDLLLLKALVTRAPGQLLRATSVAGTLILDEGCAAQPPGSVERLVVDDGVRALALREAACRGSRQAARIAARTILLIDNGLRTGETMAAAIRAVRATNPGRIVAATPVGAASAMALVGALADQVHCLVTPASLGNVAMAYQSFDVPDDAEIRDLFEQRVSGSRCC